LPVKGHGRNSREKAQKAQRGQPQPKKFNHGLHGWEARLFLSVKSVKSVVKNPPENKGGASATSEVLAWRGWRAGPGRPSGDPASTRVQSNLNPALLRPNPG
jgi:hypothetical protein